MKKIYLLLFAAVTVSSCTSKDETVIIRETSFYTGKWAVEDVDAPPYRISKFYLNLNNDGTGSKEDNAGNSDRISWFYDKDNQKAILVGYDTNDGEGVYPDAGIIFDIVENQQNYQEWRSERIHIRTDTAGVRDTLRFITFWELTRQ